MIWRIYLQGLTDRESEKLPIYKKVVYWDLFYYLYCVQFFISYKRISYLRYLYYLGGIEKPITKHGTEFLLGLLLLFPGTFFTVDNFFIGTFFTIGDFLNPCKHR